MQRVPQPLLRMDQDARSGEGLAGPQRPVKLSVVCLGGKAPLIFLPSVVELSGQQKGERAVEMRLRIIGFERQRAPVAGERLGVQALALESAAEIVMQFGATRLQSQRPFMVGDRLLPPAQIDECDAEIVARLRMVRR